MNQLIPNPYSSPINAALHLASWGLRVFPVHGIEDGACACLHDDCSSPGKHPAVTGWQELASSDAKVIAEWWGRNPSYNVGLPTGTTNQSLVVLDLDVGGAESLAALEREYGALPETYAVTTGRGRHLYFSAPQACLRNSASRLGKGIDVRGEGGFVVTVGSWHKNGVAYAAPRSAPIAALPEWVIELATRSSPTSKSDRESFDERVGVGKRNDTLFRRACAMRGRNASEEEAQVALLSENSEHCEPPLPEEEVLRILQSAWRYDPTHARATGRPSIPAGDTDLIPVVELAWEAIDEWNNPPRLFRSGGILQALRNDGHRARLVPVDEQQMRLILAEAADWYRVTKGGERRTVRPPMTIAKAALAWHKGSAPVLKRIVTAPVFGPEGKLCVEPGYHAGAQLWHDVSPELAALRVPEEPCKADVAEAVSLLGDELLGDFPFASEADLANCIGLAILPFVRDMIDGATPLHLIEKPTPGTGASLLADVLTTLPLGRPATGMTEGRAEDEWRKRITAKLMQASLFVLIDNVNSLASSALAAAITLDVFEDRLLGQSKMLQLPVTCAWIATGNNPLVSRELARRIVAIRLDAGCERPWARPTTSFRHANLRQWVTKNRARLVCAILTLVRAWVVSGRPDGTQTLGGMEKWASTIGGILETAGVPGFLSNLELFYERADHEGATWGGFVDAWWEAHVQRSVGVAELFSLVQSNDVPIELGSGSDRSQRTRLGKAIKRIEGRRFGSVIIDRASATGRAAKWRLVDVSQWGSKSSVTPQGELPPSREHCAADGSAA